MKEHLTFNKFINEANSDWSGVVISSGISELKKLAKEYKQKNMDGWKIRANHATIKAGNLPDDYELKENETVELKVTHVGWNDTALAVRISGIKTFNKISHITLAFHPTQGKGGYTSNNITNWKPIKHFNVSGKIKLGHTSFSSDEGTL